MTAWTMGKMRCLTLGPPALSEWSCPDRRRIASAPTRRPVSWDTQRLGPRVHPFFLRVLMMLGTVTVFLKRLLPCKVKDIQWLLGFVDHCHPLIVNSVSPVALLKNCLNTGFRPPWISAKAVQVGPWCSLSMNRGEDTQWGHHSGGWDL